MNNPYEFYFKTDVCSVDTKTDYRLKRMQEKNKEQQASCWRICVLLIGAHKTLRSMDRPYCPDFLLLGLNTSWFTYHRSHAILYPTESLICDLSECREIFSRLVLMHCKFRTLLDLKTSSG